MASPANLGSMPPSRDSGGSPASLVDSGQTDASDKQEQNRAFMNLVKSIHNDLDNLARQYPDMQQGARAAKKALTDAMVKRMSQQGSSGESEQAPKVAG